MAVINRALDPSEQKEWMHSLVSSLAIAGSHAIVAMAPFPAELKFVEIAAVAAANSPVLSLEIIRFVVGAGSTIILASAPTLAVTAVGTSGPQGFSLVASGSTLLQLQAGDLIGLKMAGGISGAVTNMSVDVVMKPSQDVVAHFGLST